MSDAEQAAGDGPRVDGRVFRFSVRLLMGIVLACACAFGLIAGFFDLVDNAKKAARSSQCKNNLKMIALGLINYHDTHGCFPPAYIPDADGKPMHSWRVLLLPYMESSPTYNQYRFNESWDGPNNLKLHAQMTWFYACPSDPGHLEKGLTSYFVIVGPETCFPGGKSTTIPGMPTPTGPVADTITVVECSDLAVPWMEPRDLDLGRMSFRVNDPSRPGISSRHPGGANVVMVDGRTRRLGNATPPAEVRAALTIHGRVIDRPRGTP